MIAFIRANPDAGVDTNGFIGRQNCTTAVCNTLKAGGVLGNNSSAGQGLAGAIYSPKYLLNAILSGDISVSSEVFVSVLEAAKEANLGQDGQANKPPDE